MSALPPKITGVSLWDQFFIGEASEWWVVRLTECMGREAADRLLDLFAGLQVPVDMLRGPTEELSLHEMVAGVVGEEGLAAFVDGLPFRLLEVPEMSVLTDYRDAVQALAAVVKQGKRVTRLQYRKRGVPKERFDEVYALARSRILLR